MKILSVRIESFESFGNSVREAFRTNIAKPSAGLSFPSYGDMHRVLAPKRLDIIRAMAGQGVLAYREVARRVGRDFKGVHTDITALVKAGVIDREKDGVVFPYETIHFEFDIKANAA